MKIFDRKPNIEELKEKKDVKGLIKALKYKGDENVRQKAAEALGEIKDTGAVKPLIKALDDEDIDVRVAAVEALGEIRDERAIGPLIQNFRNLYESVRVAAAEALEKIGEPAVKPLVQALHDEEYPSVRGAMKEALKKLQDALDKIEKEDSERSTPSPVRTQQAKSTQRHQSLLESLDNSEGTDELYEMLRSRSATEIEEVCKTFPIETLRLDYDSVQEDFRNSRRFELITVLAQILVRYEEILEQSTELRLPRSLPAKELAETLMSRLMPFISGQQGVEIAHILRERLYDFAMALMQAGRDRDALICFLASEPSIKEDHEFWICACRFNIAQTTESRDDISAAIDVAEQIVSGKVRVPEKYVQGAKQMLDKLKQQA